MKREIKFRAWIKTGIETYDYVEPMIIQQMIHSKKSTFSLKQLNDLVDFEQFTGLKDVNGKDIYEGDILHFGSMWCVGDECDPREEEHTGFVEYLPDHASYVVNCDDGVYTLEELASFDGYSIQGNVHESMELLEDEDEMRD